jgi:undecaprenyl diphosphate synthase
MNLPRHVAVIMDGNGRWAKQRLLPRVAGHKQGTEAVRDIVALCVKKQIPILTLWAFSSENWRRPQNEVSFLFELILKSLKQELQTLHENKVCLKVIGDRSRFSRELQEAILEAENKTAHNTGLRLNIALNYGGRWDIVQAVQRLSKGVLAGKLKPEEITEQTIAEFLCLSDCEDPDLLIRTSGEFRLSNFLLWQFAYTELYFTETLWPDFREAQFEEALAAFAKRERRFGYTGEQILTKNTTVECVNA